jgi:transcriptional regulator with XRE-family HTH domain
MTAEKKKYNSFGEHLRSLREESNLSLREVAYEFQMDTSLLAKIERNERKPNRLLIKDMAAYFNVDEQELVSQYLSDVIAYKILEEEDANLDNLLRDIEDKVTYFRLKRDQ